MRIGVVPQLVPGLGQLGELRAPRGVALDVAADDEERRLDDAAVGHLGKPRQRAPQDHVFELRRRRSQAVDVVVAGEGVEVDADRTDAHWLLYIVQRAGVDGYFLLGAGEGEAE